MTGLYQDFGEQRRFVILATEANALMIEVHNRMPVVLLNNEVKCWLDNYSAATGILQVKRPMLIKQVC